MKFAILAALAALLFACKHVSPTHDYQISKQADGGSSLDCLDCGADK